MINSSPANYFQCVLPSLEPNEEEIWFQHPTESLKCNQLGVLFFDEEEYSMVHLPPKGCYLRKRNEAGQFYISIGTKSNIVWECYHQTQTKCRIIHLNYNEIDFTISNLYSIAEETPYQNIVRNKKRRAWEKESAHVLLRKEAAAAAKGLDRETYRALMRFPAWLISAADSLI